MNFKQEEWESSASTIAKTALTLKFSQNNDLKTYLLNTATKLLAEASPYDTVWGTGIHMKDPTCFDRDKWGKNMLGAILMDVRTELAISSSSDIPNSQ